MDIPITDDLVLLRERPDICRSIDSALIGCGFSYLKEKINFEENFFGVGTYDIYYERIDQKKREIQEDAIDFLEKKIRSLEERASVCDAEISALFEEIKGAHICADGKDSLLRRLSLEKYRQAIASYQDSLKIARQHEINNVCHIWRDGDIDLTARNENVAGVRDVLWKRKQAYNAVALDAFGVLGFSKVSTSYGTAVLRKNLSEKFYATININKEAFEKTGPAFVFVTTSYFHVDDTRKPLIRVAPGFVSGFCYYAFYVYCHGVKTARDMERSIRAQAIAHELHTKAIEGFLARTTTSNN